jgi:tetratricopeptide (TPR) repeat protein
LLDVYLNLNLKDEAVRLAQAMERIPDPLPRLDYYRGLAFYKLEDYSKAKSYFTKKTRGISDRALSHLMVGQIFYVQGEDGEAEAAFRKVLEEHPWSAAAHHNLGILLEKRGCLREAVEHLEMALAVSPFSLAPRIHLIGLHDRLGDRAKQTEMLRKVLGLKPKSAEASFLKANSHLDLDETLSRYSEKFCPEDPSPPSAKTRAIIATLRGRFAEAIDLYRASLEATSDRTEAEKAKKEISRLQGFLRGREPLEVPT